MATVSSTVATVLPGSATRYDHSRPLPVDLVRAHRASWYARGKLAVDWALALVLFAASLPVLLLVMVLVRLTSRGPAIYCQTRVGLGGRPFTIYKVRTMGHECESLTGAQWSRPGDSRVTVVGRFLRKTHLDELPQLWNVLRGEMSLVGPRPERPEFVPQLAVAVPLYRERLLVRPGVTGLAQVQLPPDTDLNSVRAKITYDIHYIRNVSFRLDLQIMAATAFKLLCLPFPVIARVCRFEDRGAVEKQYTDLVRQVREEAAAGLPIAN